MINFDPTLLEATHGTFGVLATIEKDTVTFDLTVLDKTRGADVGQTVNNIVVQSVRPVIAVRGSVLAANGITDASSLEGGTITLQPDGSIWNIQRVQARPAGGGAFSGEFWLMVTQTS